MRPLRIQLPRIQSLRPLLNFRPILSLIPVPPPRRSRMFETATEASGDEQKRDSMPTMGFLDHLEELRRRLVYSIAAVAVGFFACWCKVERVYDLIQRPIMDVLKANGLSQKLVYLNSTEPFHLYMKIA